MTPVRTPLASSSEEADATVAQELRSSLSQQIDIWLRRTHAAPAPVAAKPAASLADAGSPAKHAA
jgi:hypothetical protein